MRVALIDFKDILSDSENEEIKSSIKKEYQDCIFIDVFSEDIELAEYCLDIRMYDLIFINFRNENKTKYFNLVSILAKYYELDYQLQVYCNPNEERSFHIFEDRMKEVYSSVKVNYLGSFFSKEQVLKDIIQRTEEYFLTIPIVEDISINYEDQTVNLKTEHGRVTIAIKKNIDFQILIYFMRHYGEVININSILSAITDEPELMNNSPIESSISSIRKIFKNTVETKDESIFNPIKAFKRVGYRFSI